jgi:hypothetical protein
MTNNGEAAPLTRVYAGTRVPFSAGGAVVMWSDGGKAHVLRKRLDLANHSPDGFQWGYEGSGPAQLALALLANVLGDDAKALRLYQSFKRAVIGRLDQDEWKMTAADIVDWAKL